MKNISAIIEIIEKHLDAEGVTDDLARLAVGESLYTFAQLILKDLAETALDTQDNLVSKIVQLEDTNAELSNALRETYDFLLREFRENNPTTGEVVEVGARNLWNTVCSALGV